RRRFGHQAPRCLVTLENGNLNDALSEKTLRCVVRSQLGSLVEVPVLADLGKAGADIGKVERKDSSRNGVEHEARAIIERAIKAQGGEEFYAREPPTYYTAKGILHINGTPYSYTDELSAQANRFKRVVRTEISGGQYKTTFVFNGQKGWIKDFAGTTTNVLGDD